MQDAIRLALDKGGYDIKFVRDGGRPTIPGSKSGLALIALDPAFWAALWKAIEPTIEKFEDEEGDRVYALPGLTVDVSLNLPVRLAICYFELRMTGGDEEQFWKELTKGQ